MLRRAAVNAALLARSSKPHCSAQSMLTVLSDTMQYAPVAYIQREAKSFDRGAIFFASLLWRKLTIPMVRRWSNSSDGNGTAFLFPAVLATISAWLLPSVSGAQTPSEDPGEAARNKLLQLLEGLQSDPQRKSTLGPGSALWIPSTNIRLVRVLNEGSFGKIWVGELQDSSGTQEVAVKLLAEDLLRHRSLAELLECEAEVFHRVSTRCHHVCRLYGITWKGDHLCLVMKLYKKSLSQLINEKGGHLPLSEIKKYGIQICKGLVELHDQGVIMQDLKPGNVLIDDLDNAVLADFGMASFVDRVEGSRVVTPAKGTPSYMAPEAWDPCANGGMSTKSDIWSLGCMIIELFTGNPPWHGMELPTISGKVKDGMEVPTIPSGLPASLDQALRRCFTYDGNRRPEARELLDIFMEEWKISESQKSDSMQMSVVKDEKSPTLPFHPPIEQASFYSFMPLPVSDEQQMRMKSLYEVDKDLFHAVDRLSHLMEAV